jgi:capsular exopolysaccharide synthesis family protein
VEFRDFLALVWKRRVVVAVVFLVCVLLAALFAYSQPKRYESTATIAFTPDTKNGQDFIPSDNLNALLSTYAEVAKSDQNLARARALLGHPVPGDVSTSTEGGSGILEIIGKDTSPQGAADTARATAQAFVNSISGNGLLVASIVNPAVPSHSPLQPRPPLIISMAGVLSLIAGVLLALALESFRRDVEGPAELAEVTSLPIIGRLPRSRALAREPTSLVWTSAKMEELKESYRALRTNHELLTDGASTTLQVTSADAGQGKSTVVANLGVALGQLGVPTVIVDADLRRPRQHVIFGLDNEVGLSTLMMLPDSGIGPQPTAFRDLSVLTSGPIPPDPTEMLHIRFRAALRDLKAGGGYILVDAPPILPVSDARLIAPHVDSVLFVVAVGHTRTSAVASSLEKLRFAGANVMGIALNLAERDAETAGGYGYGYGYDGAPSRSSVRAG